MLKIYQGRFNVSEELGRLLQKVTTELVCRSCLLSRLSCVTSLQPLDCSPRLLFPWDLPGKNIGWVVISSSRIFQTQGIKPPSLVPPALRQIHTHWSIEEACRRMYVVRMTEGHSKAVKNNTVKRPVEGARLANANGRARSGQGRCRQPTEGHLVHQAFARSRGSRAPRA